jgi:hypothetical protein
MPQLPAVSQARFVLAGTSAVDEVRVPPVRAGPREQVHNVGTSSIGFGGAGSRGSGQGSRWAEQREKLLGR